MIGKLVDITMQLVRSLDPNHSPPSGRFSSVVHQRTRGVALPRISRTATAEEDAVSDEAEKETRQDSLGREAVRRFAAHCNSSEHASLGLAEQLRVGDAFNHLRFSERRHCCLSTHFSPSPSFLYDSVQEMRQFIQLPVPFYKHYCSE